MRRPRVPGWLRQMTKYGLKGGTGMLVNVALLTLVVEYAGVPKAWGVPIVWLSTLIPGYLAVDKWVFSMFPSPSGLAGTAERGLTFYAVMWLGKGTNYVIYLGLIALGVPYQPAWIIGAVVVFPWNFFANRWLWRRDIRLKPALASLAQHIR